MHVFALNRGCFYLSFFKYLQRARKKLYEQLTVCFFLSISWYDFYGFLPV